MQKQHALIVSESLTIQQLEYLLLKANRLGLEKKHVVGVWEEQDKEGKHVYLGISECQKPSPS